DGRPERRANGVTPRLPGGSRRRTAELAPPVDSLWRSAEPLEPPAQPPIANIAILGSVEVAAERSSEYRSRRRVQIAAIASASSASVASERSNARRSCPSTANRQV